MAAVSALCTSPSASLTAAFSYSDPHSQYLSYPVPTATQSPDVLHASDSDDSSSSDKENCSSLSPSSTNILNQAISNDPAMMSQLQFLPAHGNMSFTPQRVRPPPRAWERRPATPFIPRSEGQKIWKRVPLQDLGIEVNQHVSRHEIEEKQSYLRVIKRLRLDNEANDGIENECGKTAIAIGTQWGEDCIEKDGSPKKKSRSQGQATMPESSSPADVVSPTQDNPRDGNISRNVSDSVQRDVDVEQTSATEGLVVLNKESASISAETFSVDNKGVSNDPRVGDKSSDDSKPSNTLLDGTMSSAIVDMSCLESLSTNVSIPPVATRPNLSFFVSDQDETAFLRDFLERAQASKAIRSNVSPQKQSSTAKTCAQHIVVDEDLTQTNELETIDEIEDDDLSPPIETAKIEQTLFISDNNMASPTRRSMRTSTRAASSRLPRFQVPSSTFLLSQQNSSGLPAAIQLKRATGNEFIFNAKTQQNLAVTTRSNTKRNQGDAIPVAQRLAQLKKELEVRQEEELATDAATSQSSHQGEEDAVVEEKENDTVKKRKREKHDVASSVKIRRTVRWPCEEELVRYREPSQIMDCTEVSECSETNLVTNSPTVGGVQSENISDAASTTEPKSSSDSATKAKNGKSIDEPSKLKVRHIRKIKLDSVNGTPAPKTRARSIQDSETDEPGTVSKPHVLSGSSTGTRKSSRMPVPVSTLVPLPGLVAAKSKTKSSDKDQQRSKRPSSTPSSVSKSDVEATAAAPDAKSNENSADVTTANFEFKAGGRRRLRERNYS